MALQALQILVTAATLLLPMVMMAPGNVTITARYGEASDFYRHLVFDSSSFTEFHECISKGADSCDVGYGLQYCPDNCIVANVIQSDQSHPQLNKYFKCELHESRAFLTCLRQTEISTTPGIPFKTYRLRNSTYPLICFGFMWTDKEGISFNSDQWDEELCGANCACPSRSTTPQLGTTSQTPSPSFVTSSSLHSSSPSATAERTTLTEMPTKLTTAVSTANSGSPSTESSSGTENSDDDPPIGVIVGAVVGVIAIIVIIIIIVMVWRRRSAKANSSHHADHEKSATSSNGAEVNGTINDGKSLSYYNTEFSSNNSESHALNNGVSKTNYQHSIHQPSISRDGVAPVKDLPKPQFAIKDNDTDFGYSTAQLVVPEDNNSVNAKKSRDDYDYVYAKDHVGVSDPTPKTTRDKTPVVSPPKVRDDYAVVDKTRKNKTPGSMATSKGLTSDYDDIPEEDYGYSHAEGDPSVQGTKEATVGKLYVAVPERNLPGPNGLHYEYSRTSDGYTTVGNVNQFNPDPNNDNPNAKSVYSRLHEPVRDIQNPYNVGPNTNDVYSKLHEEVRDIKNPYNVLPEQQGASDSNSALPDTAHNAQDTKEQKPPKSLPYGKEDYAVVVKTKSANKPTQSTFELGNDDN